MASAFGQQWTVYRFADSQIVFTEINGSTDPSTWALAFLIGPFGISQTPGIAIPTYTLLVTPSVSTTTITVGITRAQLTTILIGLQYPAALWRTNAGFEKPLAVGTLSITTIPTPP